MAAGQTIDTKIASGDSCPELKLPGLDLDGLHGRNFMVIDDEPLPTLHDGTGVGRKGYTCDRSNRPGTRGSSGRRPLTRGSSGSRPGTRENNLPGSRQSGRSDASSANQVAEADSFRLRMPSFRMTWATGETVDESSGGNQASLGVLSRDARRRRDQASTRDRDRAQVRRMLASGCSNGNVQQSFDGDYIGAQSRQEFFELYAQQKRIWSIEGLPKAEGQRSPRTHYLGQCERIGTAPLPLLIQEDGEKTDIIKLNSHGIGNKAAVAYASALSRLIKQGLPLAELHLRDNALGPGDVVGGPDGITAITDALVKCTTLRLLDLSSNDLSDHHHANLLLDHKSSHVDLDHGGPDRAETKKRLSSRTRGGSNLARVLDELKSCGALETLLIEDACMGDRVAKKVVQALIGNLSLRTLDLSDNGLGVGSPEAQSGHGAAAAVSTLLQDTENSSLTCVRLSYNLFSTKHAQCVAEALPINTSLLELDLSWNSLSDGGVMALSEGLRTNRVLERLDLTHVEVGEKGTMVIADMLKENRGLKRVLLNENPIGQRGARAVLRALRKLVQYNWDREVQIFRCNYGFTEPGLELFDPNEPGGQYECDLQDPYQRMIAWELVELAWGEEGENWKHESLDGDAFELDEPPPGVIWTRADYQLPSEGVLKVTYRATPRVHRFKDVLEAGLLDKILDLMTHREVTDYGLRLLRLASEDFWFTADYAGALLSLMRDSTSRVEASVALLPRVVDQVNLTCHVLDWLTDREVFAVQQKMGQLFNLVICNPTGHWKLQLGDRHERICVQRIVEISCEQTLYRRQHNMINTSQKGDWENFRNETLDGKEYNIDERDVAEGGLEYGLVEFDYVSTDISHRLCCEQPMPETVFRLFLHELDIVNRVVTVSPDVHKRSRRRRHRRGGHRRKPGVKVGGGLSSAPEPTCAQAHLEHMNNDAGRDSPSSTPMRGSDGNAISPQALSDGHESRHNTEQEPIVEQSGNVVEGRESDEQSSEEKENQADQQRESDDEEEIDIQAGDAEVEAALKFQAMWRGFRSRRQVSIWCAAKNLLVDSVEKYDDMSQAAVDDFERDRLAAGPGRGGARDAATLAKMQADADRARNRIMLLRQGRSQKYKRRHRHCWWIPTQHAQVEFDNVHDQRSEIVRRQCLMIRRATLQWYFSAEQVAQIVEAIPRGRQQRGQVEALVTLWSRVTDLENLHCDRILKFKGYDRDGNNYVSNAELEKMKNDPFIQLNKRLGAANLLNILNPDRQYALNLRKRDESVAAQLLVVLTAEPGENIIHESYNEMPFDVGKAWEVSVPEFGIFTCEFVTPNKSASLALRVPLAQRLFLPGRLRWKAIPPELLVDDEDPDTYDLSGEPDYSDGWTVDADGSLVQEVALAERLKDFEAARRQRDQKMVEKEAAVEAKASIRALRSRTSALDAKGNVGNGAIDLSAAVAMSLKFVRKVRGIKAEVKAPPPKPGMENTAWARNSGTSSQAANHAAAEKHSKQEERVRVVVEDVDSHNAIGDKLLA